MRYCFMALLLSLINVNAIAQGKTGRERKDSISADTRMFWQAEHRKDVDSELTKIMPNHKINDADRALFAEAETAQENYGAHTNREEFIRLYIVKKWRQEANKVGKSEELKKLTEEYGAVIAKRMVRGEAWVGMTDKMCLREFTNPNSRKTIYTKDGKTEVWVYEGQAAGCIGAGCPDLDYVITFKNHKAIAITTGG